MSDINIICLKWGTKFGPEYVNRLFAAIRRHTTLPISLHCFTDDANGIVQDGVNIHPLPVKGIDTWWNKLYLFSEDLNLPIGSKIVFFDLDTLVTGNIDDILNVNASTLVALRDFYTGIAESVKGNNNMGSGLMAWTHGMYSYIWEKFIKDPAKVIKNIHPHGDQRWTQLNTHDRKYWQDLFPDKVVSFKVHCREGLPKDAAIVCYHGKPSIPESITNTTKSWKWTIRPAPWVKEHWKDDKTPTVKTYLAFLNPNKIFGMVGRCGGGYNTVWEDWSPLGRIAREQVIKEFEAGINNICGHYSKLEESILNEGFRNPLIVTNGYPVRKSINNLPPELREKDPSALFLLEGTTGGSRLWVAQKHNIPVPCFVNDFTGTFKDGIEITTVANARDFYADKPAELKFDPKLGLVEGFDSKKVGHHLGVEWSEDKIVRQRAPLWVSIMNKYGYYVDRLQPSVIQMLADAGVVQPEVLRKRLAR